MKFAQIKGFSEFTGKNFSDANKVNMSRRDKKREIRKLISKCEIYDICEKR